MAEKGAPPKLPPRNAAPPNSQSSSVPPPIIAASHLSSTEPPNSLHTNAEKHGHNEKHRQDDDYSQDEAPPPPYEDEWHDAEEGGDPRSSSMHSLLPVESVNESRRSLLLIYIHGFMGNETSFQSFPAHVHNVLTVTLAESHTVHTKIYPRYKSRRAIDFARDDFSNWLYPNESARTDVILMGHSLGGILAAEVVLLPSNVPRSPEARQHRILGLIAFDTPFLGMHPGVVSTGIASLFRAAPEIPEPRSPQSNTLTPIASGSGSVLSPANSASSDPFTSQPAGPNYNPSFANDVIWNPSQKYWESGLHFLKKHSDGLLQASQQYVKSYLEFGGCLADYPGLQNRYDHLRELEDIDELAQRRDVQGRPYRRVRFVNYYSASTGRPKITRGDSSVALTPQDSISTGMQGLSVQTTNATDTSAQTANVPDLSAPSTNAIEFHDSGVANPSTVPPVSLEEYTDEGPARESMEELDPRPMDLSEDEHVAADLISAQTDDSYKVDGAEDGKSTSDTVPRETTGDLEDLQDVSEADSLPPVPRLPRAPEPFDPLKYKAKDTLKVAEKEHARQVKAYERARKDRDKTIREREKMLKKREKDAMKAQEKQAKIAKKNQDIAEKERLKRSTTLNPETYDQQIQENAEDTGMSEQQVLKKKQRDRKFCALPSKDSKTGLRDRTWIRVYMEGVDEVVAHTTLFNGIGEPYEKLVGDTASRIEEWVHEDRTRAIVLGEEPDID